MAGRVTGFSTVWIWLQLNCSSFSQSCTDFAWSSLLANVDGRDLFVAPGMKELWVKKESWPLARLSLTSVAQTVTAQELASAVVSVDDHFHSNCHYDCASTIMFKKCVCERKQLLANTDQTHREYSSCAPSIIKQHLIRPLWIIQWGFFVVGGRQVVSYLDQSVSCV